MSRRPRVGVVVLDHGRPLDAARAAASARDADLDVRVLIVENGLAPAGPEPLTAPAPDCGERLRQAENLGFAGGMNLGIERLRSQDCDVLLLLNNDAVLAPGCLGALVQALRDPTLAAVGPVILRESDGRVESCGLRVHLRSGRIRLSGSAEVPRPGARVTRCDALSGAVLMLSRCGVDRVGLLEDEYFFGFEDVDWCLRARRTGLGVAVVNQARAVHAGSRTLGRGSPDRLYYAARNHVLCMETHLPLPGAAAVLRRGVILALNLGFALRQGEVPRLAAARAVGEGFRDGLRKRFGPRPSR